jgi:Lrp/AsnC family transcriptional regulator, leucine-responsive regulatory protein
MDLDEFDRRLLEALQHNSHEIGEELAKLTHLSPAACLRRAKRLRDEGIIVADVSIVAPEAVGRPLMMIVLVSLEHEQIEIIESFKRSVRGDVEIMQCYYVTGPADFVLIVSAADMAGYEAFTRRYFFGNPNIRRFETLVVMDRVKFGTFIPTHSSAPEQP